MKSKLLHQTDDGLKTFALIFSHGDEVMMLLRQFAEDQKLDAAHFTAMGAFERLTVQWFDWSKKDYRSIPIEEQVEVLTLAGDVALKDGKPSVHVHLCVAKSDGTAHGGHLKEAIVRPTLELILTETPAHLQKSFDAESHLALIDLSK